MNFEEHISWLATTYSGTCFPKRIEDIDCTLPYFKLEKNLIGKYDFRPFNFETHDNAPRMSFVAHYLTNNILPHVQGNLSGYYNIQLHDHYSYLNDGKCYNDVLCFGSKKNDTKNRWVVPLPDCYFMGNWGGKYEIMKDQKAWESKKNKIVFAGTTTGSRDPKENIRINTCLWSLENGRDKYCDFSITNIAQIDAHKIFTTVPNFKYVFRPPLSLEEQMEYKYMLGIDGNTCRWNPDVYFMNTLSLCLPSNDMLWYSSLFLHGEHFVEVTLDELIKTMKFYENNTKDAVRIIDNANTLAKRLFQPDVCKRYTIELFQNMVHNAR